MAIFKKTASKKVASKVKDASATPTLNTGITHVLKHARITEKATMNSLTNTYVFNVSQSATKRDITRAIKSLYGVEPRRVTVAQVPAKNVRNPRTGKRGVKQGGKKAYVYLNKGETITI